MSLKMWVLSVSVLFLSLVETTVWIPALYAGVCVWALSCGHNMTSTHANPPWSSSCTIKPTLGSWEENRGVGDRWYMQAAVQLCIFLIVPTEQFYHLRMSPTQADNSDTLIYRPTVFHLFSSFLCCTLIFFSPKGTEVTEKQLENGARKQVCVDKCNVVCRARRWLLPQTTESRTFVIAIALSQPLPIFLPLSLF